MYITVQKASEPIIPLGRSLCGLIASSAAVETASKPTYAKKTKEAPARTPTVFPSGNVENHP